MLRTVLITSKCPHYGYRMGNVVLVPLLVLEYCMRDNIFDLRLPCGNAMIVVGVR